MIDLYKKAEALAGRPVEVEKVAGGKYAVIWFNYSATPPTPGNTEEEALLNFIAKLEATKEEMPE